MIKPIRNEVNFYKDEVKDAKLQLHYNPQSNGIKIEETTIYNTVLISILFYKSQRGLAQ